jgi:hypothetical protein
LKKEKLVAWRKFKEDADAVKATALGKPWQQFEEITPLGPRSLDTVSVEKGGNQGKHAHAERLLLDKLLSEECADQVAGIWTSIDKYRQKKLDNGQRLIKCLLDAFTLSQHVLLIVDDYQRNIDRLREVQDLADQLEAYFASGAEQAERGDAISRDPMWKIFASASLRDPPDFVGFRTTLSRIKGFLSERADEFSKAFDELNLSRKNKSASSARVAFTAAMSVAMCDIFGRPLDDVVRQLTDVIFSDEVTVDQVKEARKSAAERRRAGGQDIEDLFKLMRRHNIPITRENYLELAYPGEPTAKLSEEEEAYLPPEIRNRET